MKRSLECTNSTTKGKNQMSKSKSKSVPLTFGTDPEFMIFDPKKNKVVSSIPLFKGDKTNKTEIGNFSFYSDNVLVEGTLPPTTGVDETVKNIGDFLKCLTKHLAPNKILCRASHVYDDSELEHEKAREIGCVRENDIYSLEMVEPPIEKIGNSGLRSAGGHIHLGVSFKEDIHKCRNLLRILDLYVGIPSLFLDGDPTSARRRELYGNAGRYRQTPYGVEYRSQGNWWIASPKTVALIYDLCKEAVDTVSSGKIDSLWKTDIELFNSEDFWTDPKYKESDIYSCVGYDSNGVINSINTTNKKEAEKHLASLKKFISPELFGRLEKQIGSPKYFDLDVYAEWGL